MSEPLSAEREAEIRRLASSPLNVTVTADDVRALLAELDMTRRQVVIAVKAIEGLRTMVKR